MVNIIVQVTNQVTPNVKVLRVLFHQHICSKCGCGFLITVDWSDLKICLMFSCRMNNFTFSGVTMTKQFSFNFYFKWKTNSN